MEMCVAERTILPRRKSQFPRGVVECPPLQHSEANLTRKVCCSLRQLSSRGAIVVTILLVATSLIIFSPLKAGAQIKQADDAPRGNAQNGKQMFSSEGCGKCHGSEGQGQNSVTSIAGPQIAPPPLSFQEFVGFLRQPGGQMPPFSNEKVSETQLADIYVFLRAAAPGTQTNTAPAGNAENGKRIFVSYGCYECHDRNAQGARGTAPRLGPPPIPFEAFARQVRHPADQMPVYTTKVVSDTDLADIYAFLQSLPRPQTNNIPLLK